MLRVSSPGSGIRKNSDMLEPAYYRNSCEFRYKSGTRATGIMAVTADRERRGYKRIHSGTQSRQAKTRRNWYNDVNR